jgi:hypothetical protein
VSTGGTWGTTDNRDLLGPCVVRRDRDRGEARSVCCGVTLQTPDPGGRRVVLSPDPWAPQDTARGSEAG